MVKREQRTILENSLVPKSKYLFRLAKRTLEIREVEEDLVSYGDEWRVIRRCLRWLIVEKLRQNLPRQRSTPSTRYKNFIHLCGDLPCWNKQTTSWYSRLIHLHQSSWRRNLVKMIMLLLMCWQNAPYMVKNKNNCNVLCKRIYQKDYLLSRQRFKWTSKIHQLIWEYFWSRQEISVSKISEPIVQGANADLVDKLA